MDFLACSSPGEFRELALSQAGRCANRANWAAILDLTARFPGQSLVNLIAISVQAPYAADIRTAAEWRQVGQHVLEGAMPIRLLAFGDADQSTRMALPSPLDSVADPAGGSGSGLVDAWDSSAVKTGSALAAPVGSSKAQLEPELRILASLAASRGYRLIWGRPEIGGRGITKFASRTITINPQLSDLEQVSTLAHELAHVLLHSPRSVRPDISSNLMRRELEAKSVARAWMVSLGYPVELDTCPGDAFESPTPQLLIELFTRVRWVLHTIRAYKYADPTSRWK